jgi:hypothetical protein
MRPPFLPRLCLWLFSLAALAGVLFWTSSAAQPLMSADPVLSPEQSKAVAEAARDTLLPDWQREFMLHLARGDEGPARDPAALDVRLAPAGRATTAGDGAWKELALAVRYGHTAIYDPVRDRMLVIGGHDLFSNGYFNDVWALSLAGTPAWSALATVGAPPMARAYHSAIYDPVRDRMVVFGGYDGSGLRNDVWALSLAGTLIWSSLAPSGAPPCARDAHTAIYDPVRDRMVVFGGGDGLYRNSVRNDVWALSLAGTPAWSALVPSGAPPIARSGHSAIYDPVRDRMVVFGGVDESWYRNDTWALSLNTPQWTELAPSGTPPSVRCFHSAIYDPVRDRMVVLSGWGEYDGYSRLRYDVWALSLAGSPAWSASMPPGPACYQHSAIHDPVRDRMVVFGGAEGVDPGRDHVWMLSLASPPTWTRLAPSGTPPVPRDAHAAIYDPVRNRVVVFGGWDCAYLNDVSVLSLVGTPTWTPIASSGGPLSARSAHTAIYDPVRDRMVVFGGWDGSSYRNDVWALSLAGTPAWSALAPSGTPPSARCYHTAIYDPVRDRMVVFGGAGSSLDSDAWALSLAGTPEWTEITPSGTAPCARYSHTAIYDPVRDRMMVFGGYEGTSYRNDVWALSLAGTPAWSALAPSGTPPSARSCHSAIYDPVRDRMVVFGGGAYCNDVWALSLGGTPAWSALAPSGTPPNGRYLHSAIYDPLRDRMVVFGGAYYYPAFYNDVWELGWGTPVATLISLVGATAEPSRVRLDWFCPTSGLSATLYREEPGKGTSRLAVLTPDGSGRLTYEDNDVTAGRRYRYVLGIMEGGREELLGEVWVDVPLELTLAIHDIRPNPATPGAAVSLSLPGSEPARLEVLDVAGRRVLTRSLDGLGPGRHLVRLDPEARLQGGVYFVRLTQGARAVSRRAVFVR